MPRSPFLIAMVGAVSLAALGSMALAAQDRYTLKIPNGPAFSDFKGYENWQYVAVSQTEDGLKVIAANPTMMKAYRSGTPGNGHAFPEGSKIVKIEWSQKKETQPYFVVVPDKLKSVSFIEKDSKRFKSSDGWGYAQFQYDATAATFKPFGNDAACGHACHTAVKTQDFIFTAYPPR
jgi:hypothetical protein